MLKLRNHIICLNFNHSLTIYVPNPRSEILYVWLLNSETTVNGLIKFVNNCDKYLLALDIS